VRTEIVHRGHPRGGNGSPARLRLVVTALLCCLAASQAAALTPQQYRDVGISLPAAAAVPLDAAVTDDDGRRTTLRELIAGPAVLVFADYTCTTLCGPIVAFVSAALEQSGLIAKDRFQLIIVGLDPKDTAADAMHMRRAALDGDAVLDGATRFVTADEATIHRLTQALGYRYAYDADHDQFVHPGAAYVLRADGQVSRVLTGLGLSGGDMRLALVEAGEGRIGTIGDEVRLLCSGFDPAQGTYNLMISRILAVVALATVLALGAGIALLVLAGRRRVA
jgi:protein SCO1/2